MSSTSFPCCQIHEPVRKGDRIGENSKFRIQNIQGSFGISNLKVTLLLKTISPLFEKIYVYHIPLSIAKTVITFKSTASVKTSAYFLFFVLLVMHNSVLSTVIQRDFKTGAQK